MNLSGAMSVYLTVLAASTQLVYAKTLLKRRLESAMNSILAHCKITVLNG